MKIALRRIAAAALAVVIGGCGSIQYTYTATSTAQGPAKPDCDFQVLATPPEAGEYEEIGFVEPVDRRPTDQVGEFKMLVRPHVCQAGGDAVLGELNRGTYVRGVVLRRAPAK